jgi:LysR family transcriptional activator of nhaA
MEWLNYHHLLYFWVVAREGGVSAAAVKLHLAQPTLSNQIRQLEKNLGAKLLVRRGRGVELTETGQIVFRYANEIFQLGREMTDAVRGRPTAGEGRLVLGVPDVLPKMVVHRLIQPALAMPEPVHLETYEGKLEDLLADLAAHRLDVVFSETPLSPTSSIRAFNHLLGECSLTCFAVGDLARKYRSDFPQSLHGAPMLLPTQNTLARRSMEQWFDEHQIRPQVRHEFQDSALLKVFGQEGEGIFMGSSAIESEICRRYGVRVVGRIPELRERYYALSVERRLKHPAVLAITRAARDELFRRRTETATEGDAKGDSGA